MDSQEFRKTILRWSLPVLAVTALGGAVAFGVQKSAQPVYDARGSLLVLGQVQEASGFSLTAQQVTNTDAALLTATPLLEKVIGDAKLNDTADSLGRKITVKPQSFSELLDVTVRDTDPRRAARIANTLMNDFISRTSDQSAALTSDTISSLQAQVAAAQARLATDQAALSTVADRSKNTSSEKSAVDADTAQITQLTTQLAQYQAQQASAPKPMEVAAPATVPTHAAGISRPLAIALGALLGAALSVAFVLAFQYLDQGLRNEEDVRRRLGLATLGVVPDFKAATASKGVRNPKRLEASAAAGEAYRRLRTNLLFTGVDNSLNSIVVTSTRAGEGKSRTAANLAGVLAAAGERVLLVDADLRRPTQHRIFGAPIGKGMSDLLLQAAKGRGDLDGTHRRETEFTNLSLITSGTIPPNPAELVSSKHVGGVLRELERHYDWVVIDSPPADVVTDALSMSARASGCIVVVDAKSTNAVQARRTLEALRGVGGNVLGVVLNKTQRRGIVGYYGNYRSRGQYDAILGVDHVTSAEVSRSSRGLTWVPLGIEAGK